MQTGTPTMPHFEPLVAIVYPNPTQDGSRKCGKKWDIYFLFVVGDEFADRAPTEAPVPRKKTRPGRAAKEQRLKDKAHRARVKQGRKKLSDD